MLCFGEFDWFGPEASPASAPPLGFVEAFSSSMPRRYRVMFDVRAIREHAAICYRRGGDTAHVEVWRTHPDGSAAFCVVADDRPGFLAAVAAALVSHQLDVLTALVFSRDLGDGRCEAVDVMWVRRANPGDYAVIDKDEALSIGEVLGAILSGNISVEEIATRASSSVRKNDPPDIVVRLDEVDAEGRAQLFIESADGPGILLAIAYEVFQQGAQIVRSLVRTANGRVFNHFELVEFSGAPLSPERCAQIRAAVFAALSLRERSPERPAAERKP